jgi:hypothetical protein
MRGAGAGIPLLEEVIGRQCLESGAALRVPEHLPTPLVLQLAEAVGEKAPCDLRVRRAPRLIGFGECLALSAHVRVRPEIRERPPPFGVALVNLAAAVSPEDTGLRCWSRHVAPPGC